MIYLVFGVVDYEGEYLQGAFKDKDTAERYCEALFASIHDSSFDSYIIIETELL